MSRFFAAPENIDGDTIYIVGADAFHIARSLRMRVGEELIVCCQNTDYRCRLERIRDEQVTLSVISKCRTESEPSLSLTLFQAVPKSDKLDFIVQKAVELGAVRIVPVLSARCVSRPEKKSFEKRLLRLQKISEQAAKQSGRGIIPEVGGIISFEDYIGALSKFDLNIMCYEEDGGRLCETTGLENAKTVSLFVGSEGGIEAYEAKAAEEKGAYLATLGKRILRCETAPLCAMSIIMSLSGNI